MAPRIGEEALAVAADPASDGGDSSSSDSEENTNSSTRATEQRPLHAEPSGTAARVGHVVTLDLSLEPNDGFVPEPLFDRSGRISFVVGWGNYLPGLHELVLGCRPGDTVTNVKLDAGWGERRDDLVVHVPRENLEAKNIHVDHLKPGSSTLVLQGGVTVSVLEVTSEHVVLDANPPLAGSSYDCSFTVVAVDALPSYLFEYHDSNKSASQTVDDNDPKEASREFKEEARPCCCYQVATFALDCFWGPELAFLRVPGVVGTKVGYTQGLSKSPNYQEVCEGRTKHREAVMVVFDTRQVSYRDLVIVALERLEQTTSSLALHRLFQEDDDEEDGNPQYKHGFYYHSAEQERIARESVGRDNRFRVEVLQACTFYNAEEEHQKYLFKGGQSTRKGEKTPIRCFG